MTMHEKAEAQFWVAIASVLAVAFLAGGSLIADTWRGQISQITTLLAGGLISLAGSSSSWLYRNGNNGNGSSAELLEQGTGRGR